MRVTFSPLALLLAAACAEPFTASVQDRDAFTPPAGYATWWTETEACSGLSGDLGRINWYLASTLQADGVPARARWSPPHDIIIVRGYEDDEKVVRHEMLHDLLDGDRLHQLPVWTTCGLAFP